jgi:hypothetical protein
MKIKFKTILTIKAALAAVQQNGVALQYVPEALRTEAVALAAVQQNGWALQLVPEALRTEAVALAAVQQDGWALEYVLDKALFLKIAAQLDIDVEAD